MNERAGKISQPLVAAQARSRAGRKTPRADQAARRAAKLRATSEHAPENALTSGSADAETLRGKMLTAREGRRAGVRHQQPALARIDHRRDRHPGVSPEGRAGRSDPCGASPRVGRRSHHPRLHRDGREPVGLRHRQGPAGLRRAGRFADDIRRMVAEVFGGSPKPAAEAADRRPPSARPNRQQNRAKSETAEPRGGAVPSQEIAGPDQEQTPPEAAAGGRRRKILCSAIK